MDDLISYYFHQSFTYSEIILFLFKFHNIDISVPTLKRRLREMHLYRRKYFTNIEIVATFLERQVRTSGRFHGYRWMHLKCIQAGYCVTRETIRHLLQIIDPVGVATRRRRRLRRRQYSNKGPNFLWHLDGYDKLKPYGICISGCIDGFSRKIIWLRASFTNKDPKVIAGYYVKELLETEGCPRSIRADMGTENVYVENMQIFLRQQCTLEENSMMPSFLYGTSQNNQRIEAWWSVLRKHNSQFWIDLFQTLKDDGLYDGTFLDKSVLQYCFMDIIQAELDEVRQEWNTHFIRRSRNSVSPCGRPIIMYNMPELYGTRNYAFAVEHEHLLSCSEECLFLDIPCDKDVFDLCEILVLEMNISKSSDPYDAIDLYINLRNDILSAL